MQKIIIFLLIISIYASSTAQQLVLKQNPINGHYEYYTSSGQLIGHREWNSTQNQWEFYSNNNHTSEYSKPVQEYISTIDVDLVAKILNYKQAQQNLVLKEQYYMLAKNQIERQVQLKSLMLEAQKNSQTNNSQNLIQEPKQDPTASETIKLENFRLQQIALLQQQKQLLTHKHIQSNKFMMNHIFSEYKRNSKQLNDNLANGWHDAYIMDTFHFQQIKVWVEDNHISKWFYENQIRTAQHPPFNVDSFEIPYPIHNFKSKIWEKPQFDTWRNFEILFMHDLRQMNHSTSAPKIKGKVAFMMPLNSNVSVKYLKITVDGFEVGILTDEYDTHYLPFDCGEYHAQSSVYLTKFLEEGSHSFRAESLTGSVWFGKFNVSPESCSQILLSVKNGINRHSVTDKNVRKTKVLDNDFSSKIPLACVYFLDGSTEEIISSAADSAIMAIVDRVKKDDALKIYLTTYSDDDGSKDYNDTLSRKRAWVVKKAIWEKGIAPSRIIIEANNGNQEISIDNRLINRRVEIEIR